MSEKSTRADAWGMRHYVRAGNGRFAQATLDAKGCPNCRAIITKVIPGIRDNDPRPVAPVRMREVWPDECHRCSHPLTTQPDSD